MVNIGVLFDLHIFCRGSCVRDNLLPYQEFLIVPAFASEKCEDLKHIGLMFTHMFAGLHVVQWTASCMRILG